MFTQAIDVKDDGNDLNLEGKYKVSCSDGTSADSVAKNTIILKTINNRPPMFNERTYTLFNVSRKLPGNLNLLAVYPNQIEIWVQDIDRNADGQMDDAINIKVSGTYNGTFPKDPHATSLIDELHEVFMASKETAFKAESAFCTTIGGAETYRTYPIALTLTKPFPREITSPYTFSLISKVRIV